MVLCRPLVAARLIHFFAIAAVGCTGTIADPTSSPSAAPAGSQGGPSGTGSQPAGGSGDESFTLPVDSVTLLPFSVRVEKVAHVAGVTASDPLLQTLRDAAGDLGGYDFANNRKPDSTWTALRISAWIRAVKPVCASPQMRGRFAALPDALPALIEAAYGRAITGDDRAAVDAGLMGLALDDNTRYEAVCLSVISSLEFLAQ
jgi:hypothetical protein